MKTRKLDTLKITVTPGQSTHTALYGATSRDGEKYNHGVCIDDEYIWSNGVRIRDFADMLNTPGDYWPFFCSYCGEPGCADIFYPVRCFHKEDLLVLVIRRPLQDTCIECENSGKCEMEQNRDAFVCPKRRPHYRAYCIPKDEVRQQLAALEKEFGNSLD